MLFTDEYVAQTARLFLYDLSARQAGGWNPLARLMPLGEAASPVSNGGFEAPVELADSYNYDVSKSGSHLYVFYNLSPGHQLFRRDFQGTGAGQRFLD